MKDVNFTFKTIIGIEKIVMHPPENKKNFDLPNVDFTRKETLQVCAWAFLKYILQSASTDYFLPIIIAVVTVYYCHSLMADSAKFIFEKLF